MSNSDIEQESNNQQEVPNSSENTTEATTELSEPQIKTLEAKSGDTLSLVPVPKSIATASRAEIRAWAELIHAKLVAQYEASKAKEAAAANDGQND